MLSYWTIVLLDLIESNKFYSLKIPNSQVMNDLLLLALDYLILSNIVISNSTLSKPYRSRVFIMLVTIISTISFHLAYFVLLKEKNIFETHQTARFDDRIAQAAKTNRLFDYHKLLAYPADEMKLNITFSIIVFFTLCTIDSVRISLMATSKI